MRECYNPFMRSTFLILFLAFVTIGPVAAQSREPVAVIAYADGDGIAVFQDDGSDLEVDPFDAIGFELFNGDTVVTEDATFVEVVILGTGNTLKIAENTNFQIRDLQTDEVGDFALAYGRVRAKVERLTPQGRYYVFGPEAVAGVRGTDFGVDVIAPANLEPSASLVAEVPASLVYVFEGEVEVIPTGERSGGADPDAVPVAVTAGQMVRIEADQSTEVLPLADEIRTYWQENDFLLEAEELARWAAGSSPEKAATEGISSGDGSEPDVRLRARRFGVAGGVLTAVGVVAGVSGGMVWTSAGSYPDGSDQHIRRQVGGTTLVATGAVAVGAAIMSLVKAATLSRSAQPAR